MVISQLISYIFCLFIYSDDSTAVKILIAGAECTVNSVTNTQIKCETGSYAYSSIQAPIQVFIGGAGLALNVIYLILLNVILSMILL